MSRRHQRKFKSQKFQERALIAITSSKGGSGRGTVSPIPMGLTPVQVISTLGAMSRTAAQDMLADEKKNRHKNRRKTP